MKSFWLLIYRLSRARLRAQQGPRMTCCACGHSIHRNDRYRVLEVQHVDCTDTKLVGQMSFDQIGSIGGSVQDAPKLSQLVSE
jgi:hypothetical protein